MANAVDFTKFIKKFEKNPNISRGFHDPIHWVDTGHALLNYFISGNFKRGIPLSKVVMFAGESGCLPESSTVKIKFSYEDISDVVTVKELKELYFRKPMVLIETPDGYHRITEWFDKGLLGMVDVTTKEGKSTRCAHNHMIQLKDFSWVFAKDLMSGMEVITDDGIQTLKDVFVLNRKEECFDFTVDHPNHRYFGDGFSSHNSGKSVLATASLAKHAQAMGIMPIIIDTENALDKEWLEALGVDTDPDKLMKFNLAKVNELGKVMSEFVQWYKAENDGLPEEEKSKVLFLIDSIGMLITDNDEKQFTEGNMKGDMGLKAKQLTAFVRSTVHQIASEQIGVVMTNHTYASQDMFSPDDKVSGGSGLVYAASIVVATKKLKEKNGSEVRGIKAKSRIMKSRYGRPFISADVIIDFDTGLERYSGLLEYFIKLGIITQAGAYCTYEAKDGNIYKDYKTKFKDEWLEIAIDEFDYDKHALKSKEIAEEEVSEENNEE